MSNDSIPFATDDTLTGTDAMAQGQRSFVNYYEIVRQLMVGSRIQRHNIAPALGGVLKIESTKDHLENFHVGVHGHRQTGKTHFASGMLKTKNGHLIDNVAVIVSNKARREQILERVGADVAQQVFTGIDIATELNSKATVSLDLRVDMPVEMLSTVASVNEARQEELRGWVERLFNTTNSGRREHTYDDGTRITESYSITPSVLTHPFHIVNRVSLVIIDEAKHVFDTAHITLETISKWSRACGRCPEIVTIN